MLLQNCTIENLTKTKPSVFLDDPFINKGFALIYNNDLYEKKLYQRKLMNAVLLFFKKI